MSHILAVGGHRRGRGFSSSSGGLFLVTGAASKGSHGKRGDAGEDEIFFHGNIVKVDTAGAHGSTMHTS